MYKPYLGGCPIDNMLYRYVTRTNVPFFDHYPDIEPYWRARISENRSTVAIMNQDKMALRRD